MNLEEIFEASYERVIGQGIGITEKGQSFFMRFYEIFLNTSDKVPEKFKNTDMNRQVLMIQKGLYQLISFYLIKNDSDYLIAIAESHNKKHYDIEPELYDLWLKALLQAVEELDPEYHEGLRLAWEIVMTPGILYMKYHHDS